MKQDSLKKIVSTGVTLVLILCILVIFHASSRDTTPSEMSEIPSGMSESGMSEVTTFSPAPTATKDAAATATADEEATQTTDASSKKNRNKKTQTYSFRNSSTYQGHFQKHGKEMGYATAEDYLAGANAVIQNPKALHKYEKEDNDSIYYVPSTNEFVVVSTDGYIRTYYICSGRAYFERQ